MTDLVDIPAREVQGSSSAPEPDSGPGPVSVGSTSVPDHLLLARLRRGDAAAFEALVRAHQDRVYDFCVRMLGDREEAFDLTQEIFLSVHQNVDRFRADAKLTTWLYRISRNHCLNRLKYLKRRGRGRSDDFSESNELDITQAMGGAAQPDDALDAQRSRQLVHQAIEGLDEAQRALVILRDVEGLSYEEIMEITDLAEGTVKSRLHRAREKLAGILEKLEASFSRSKRT
jgi:RNA polymerase sigma-70 factor (ECF subfamily)